LAQRIVIEKKGCGSGCGTVFALALVVGLIFVYWYIAVAVVGVGAVAALIYRLQVKKKARRRSGPRDPWINEVSVSLAELGFTERARNTGSTVGSVPFEGDIQVIEKKFLVTMSLFSSAEQARAGKTALLAQPKMRDAVKNGRVILEVNGRVLYSAYGRGTVADEFRLAEVIEVVRRISPSAVSTNVVQPRPVEDALPVASSTSAETVVPPAEPAAENTDGGDTYEQLRKLGELRAAGVITDAEFEEKKAKLLKKI